jgi:hypothetical protein
VHATDKTTVEDVENEVLAKSFNEIENKEI